MNSRRPSRTLLAKQIATVGGLGDIPFAPGTIGSGVGLGLYLGVRMSAFGYWNLCAVVLILGWWSCSRAEKFYNRKDPPQVIIDEVLGMLLCFSAIPFSPPACGVGFVFFRIFDIFKPFPAGRAQNLPGSAGILLDDCIAAVYTMAVLGLLRGYLPH